VDILKFVIHEFNKKNMYSYIYIPINLYNIGTKFDFL